MNLFDSLEIYALLLLLLEMKGLLYGDVLILPNLAESLPNSCRNTEPN